MTKTALVTGAASGIGNAIATGLAWKAHHVVLVVRSPARGEEAMREIRVTAPDAGLETLPCDLSSQASIRAAAASFLARHDRLDVLVNCAGVFRKTRSVAVDGLEETFATNYLGYFLLTNLLLPALRRAGASRIVNIASKYSNGPWVSRLNFQDLQTTTGKYTARRSTPPTMVARVLFTQELAERLAPEGITVNARAPRPREGHAPPARRRWALPLDHQSVWQDPRGGGGHAPLARHVAGGRSRDRQAVGEASASRSPRQAKAATRPPASVCGTKA